MSTWKDHLLIGGVSRAITTTILYPLDTLKTTVQNGHKSLPTSYYNGYRIALYSQFVYGMTVFGAYENIKHILENSYPNMQRPTKYLASAVLADIAGSIVLTPAEVIKQNLQVKKYNTIKHAYQTIYLRYGWSGFYHGYVGLILRDVPFRAIQLPIYDSLKDNYTANSLIEKASYGAIAGMIAAFITNPLDVIKTQMMCQNKSIFDTSHYSKGISYRTTYLGLSSALFFTIYESLYNIVYLSSRK